jgi:hypothetical protein
VITPAELGLWLLADAPGRNAPTSPLHYLAPTRLCQRMRFTAQHTSLRGISSAIPPTTAAGRLYFGWASQQAEAFASGGTGGPARGLRLIQGELNLPGGLGILR